MDKTCFRISGCKSKYNVLKHNNKFRLIQDYNVSVDNSNLIATFIQTYKIQFKVLFFWITITEFAQDIYDEDAEFCKNEAIEVYNYLTK